MLRCKRTEFDRSRTKSNEACVVHLLPYTTTCVRGATASEVKVGATRRARTVNTQKHVSYRRRFAPPLRSVDVYQLTLRVRFYLFSMHEKQDAKLMTSPTDRTYAFTYTRIPNTLRCVLKMAVSVVGNWTKN